MLDVKGSVVAFAEQLIGRHDQPSVFSRPAGDPGLCGPGSVSWRLHGDMGVFAGTGIAAIVMELLHPLVMAGVFQNSSYQEQLTRRGRATFGYVVVTTYGSTAAATRLIRAVRKIHGGIAGVAPDGRPYRADDPKLLTWVHTAIPWAMLRSWERYRGPLSAADKDRYLAEQAVIGRLGGARDVPETMRDLREYVEAMRPRLEATDGLRDFLRFATSAPLTPGPLVPVERLRAQATVQASMSLMPRWAREMTGTAVPEPYLRGVLHPLALSHVALMRWAFGEPAYKRLAKERVRSAEARAA